MKRTITIILAFTVLSVILLTSCSNISGVMVYHETAERMQDELSFTMKKVPEENNILVYGTMDEKLGEIRYAVQNDGGRMNGTLIFRMAETSYANETFGKEMPGIAGIAADSPVFDDAIGSYKILYYISGATVFAVWADDSYSYSVAFDFTDKEITPMPEDIRNYVIAIISTK